MCVDDANLRPRFASLFGDIPTVWAIAQADIGEDHIDRMPVPKIAEGRIPLAAWRTEQPSSSKK